ncbi:hypothetical protein LJK87_20265 [Paenibacillus sp. P25]|nr:hypothetical protein LJK87_20265 [Paenibacillus sp. P25]
MSSYVDRPDGVFPSVCSLDCPDQCGPLVHKSGGKIVKIEGDPQHPVTQGNICNKVRHMTERIYDPKRLTHPLKRVGPKGKGGLSRSAGRRPSRPSPPAGRSSSQNTDRRVFCPTASTGIWGG